ncbi:hypothetical protein COO60DRAFT_33644 [Scenedesmus sp. NREL 46B-D3]|nr:hypothetical protein COO60DRAFT_33644 [Scenedesmus sp. NREL 46B-D3]
MAGAAVSPVSQESSTPFELATNQAVVVPGQPASPRTLHAEAALHQQQPRRRGLGALLRCSCFGGADSTAGSHAAVPEQCSSSLACNDSDQSQLGALPGRHSLDVVLVKSSGSPRKSGSMSRRSSSPRKFHLGSSLRRASSTTYSDVDWHDAESHFSGGASDQEHALEEVAQMVKESQLGPLGKTAPWIPQPPLAFGNPGMQFVRVPAVTGFAAFWLRDDKRTTPFPQPIDLMLKASYLVQKVHASIPGILIDETATELSIVANPKFLPAFLGIDGYAEQYDKSNQVEHSWFPRRDLKMGRAYGKLYMTADGMLIARVWQRPAFSDKVEVIMEEYMRLEEGGQVIVDKMTGLHVESGKRATQYLVGHRRPLPEK